MNELILTVIVSVLASSGLWQFIIFKANKKSAANKLLLGLSYVHIIEAGERFIKRGCITSEDYHEFLKYLYEPYKEQGGNGTADKIKGEIDKLPFVDFYDEERED